MSHYRRSGGAILLMALASPVWGIPLHPTSLTPGRALILLAAALLAYEHWRAPRPRARVPRAVWLLLAALTALWAWAGANAALWGCGACGGELAGFTELVAVCALTAVIAALEPSVRSALALAVFVAGTLEALLALGGLHGLWSGTLDTSTVQGRVAGTFGNPNALAIALAFAVPAGLMAMRVHPRWRIVIACALALIGATIVLSLSRSGLLAAVAGGAVVVVFDLPARSFARRAAIAGLVAAALLAGGAYPLFTALRQHAESAPADPALRSRDRSGWDGTRLGMVSAGDSTLTNPAPGELEVGTPRVGQGVSRAVGAAREGQGERLTFEARAVRGSQRIGFGLQDGNRLNGPVSKQATVDASWRPLSVRWRPTGDSPYARLYVWSAAGSAGFVLRNVRFASRPIDVRLAGSVYAQLVAQREAQQRRDIDSRRFAASMAVSAFAAQPLRGIGWGHFVDYSAAHGSYGHLPTHDEYLRFLAELGAPGALLLLTLVATIGWAAWSGARDRLGLAITGMLVTGAVGLAFINGVVEPYVTLALAFAAALACARARVRAPAVAREAAPWWPAYFGPAARPVPWRITLQRPRIPVDDWALVREAFERAAPQPLPLALAFPQVRRFAPPVRELPELSLPDVGRTVPPARPLPGVPEFEPTRPPLRELPALPSVKPPAPRLRELPAPRLPRRVPRKRAHADPPSGYRPALDGLRAVAVLAVIGYHLTARVTGGFLGVDVFFVLSGYLITSILLDAPGSPGGFWVRRARRLLPAVVVLVLVCALEIAHNEDVSMWALRRSDLLATLFYFANWHFVATDQSYFATFLGASPVRHTWTLAIEEQFYLVWPVVVFIAYRFARGRRALPVLIVAGAVASAIAMALLYDPRNPSRSYFGTDTRAQALLIGAGLALLMRSRADLLTGPRARAIARWAWIPLALALLAAFLLTTDHSALYYRGGAPAFAVLVVLVVCVLEAGPAAGLGAVLAFAPLRWIGRISYGLYLWQWPVIVWLGSSLPNHGHLRKLLELAVIFAIATTSFYVLEQPIRARRILRAPRRLVIVLGIAVAAVALETVDQTTVGSAAITRQLAPVAPLPCPGQTVLDSYSWCPRRLAGPDAPVVASIGDSTSQALYPGMRDAARSRGWTYIEAAEGGCSALPLLLVEFPTPRYTAKAKRCVTDIRQIIDAVRNRYHPDVWVLTDRWPLAPLVTGDGTQLTPTDPRRDAPIRIALHALLKRLTAGGSHVLLVPTPPRGEPVDCALRSPAPTVCASAAYTVRDPATARLTANVHAAVAGLRRVTTVGIDDVVCPDAGHCPAMIGGTVVRYDGIHYSGPYSRKLVSVILDRATRLGLSFAPLRSRLNG